MAATDRDPMLRALALAERSVGLSDPNPRVGCVVVGDGWSAEGWTQAAGDAHAEVMALRAARTAGHDPRGATVYVTLEPCSHHGRTPPCCDALIAAGVGRVVVAVADPNPRVGGGGLQRLRDAGVAVALADPDVAQASRELNIGFFTRMTRGRPWVRMKVAASLDGRTALANGASQWITGDAARADGHAWRRRAGAVLTGIGTVVADDPRLDVRAVATQRQPLRAVVDSTLRLPATARLLDAPGAVVVYTAAEGGDAAAALLARGAELCRVPRAGAGIDLAAVVADLARREVNEVHVEAGPTLNAALLRAALVDELLLYMAPKLIGAGSDIAALGAAERLADALALRFVAVDRVGDDLRIRARVDRATP